MDLGRMVDVAIGLSMMFLMLSLFCTIINEFFNSITDLRSRTLKTGLWRLAAADPEFLKVLAHPTIVSAALDPKNVATHLDAVNTTVKAAAKDSTSAAAAAASLAATAVGAAGPQTIAEANAAHAVATTAAAVAAAAHATAAEVADKVKDVAASVEVLIGKTPQHQQSYISGRAFAGAVLDTLNPDVQLSDSETYATVMNAIGALPDGHLKQVMRSAVNNTTADIQAVRDAIAQWFDDEMERVQGVYKRWQQVIALVVGLVLAVILNADALTVGKVLWQDHNLSAQLSGVASTLLASDPAKTLVDGACKPAGDPSSAPTEDCKKAVHTLAASVGGNLTAISASVAPLPIGWKAWDEVTAWLDGLAHFSGTAWSRFFGLLLTALALSLGAPFWFNTLGKVANLRSAGPKPAPTGPGR